MTSRSKNQRKTGRSARTRRPRNQPRAIPNNIPRLIQNGEIVHGFPDKMVAKLRFHQTGTFTSTLGAVNSITFRWNSTFDPFSSGGGHQPLYRDTYASIYDQYAVISATADVKFINVQAVSPMIVGVVTDDDTTISTAIDTVCEQNHGQSVTIPPLAGSLSTHSFYPTWACKDVLNIDPFTSELYKTPVGSDPAEQSILALFAASADGLTAAVYYDILITYTVLWTELSTPTQS